MSGSMAFRPPVILQGRQVCLAPLSHGHLEALVRAGDSPEIWEYLHAGDSRGPERMRALIQTLLDRQAAGTDLAFTVLAVPGLEPIGMTRYLHILREDRCVEIGGTWYARARWRTAVNTESKLMLLRHAFETEGCHRVELRTDERNVRSQRAIERLGALKEALLREHMVRRDGTFRSSYVYGIVASEWPAVRARLELRLAAGGAPGADRAHPTSVSTAESPGAALHGTP
ncbi:MAG TPA: GNAT family protein [Thermoplasmata archaeon]|nr:GNAT family protein [Thermoplasmata archaeon]